MQLHGIKPAQQTGNKDTSENSLHDPIEAFDETGKARQAALESALNRLSEALRGISIYESESESTLVDICKETILAVRETTDTLDKLNKLVRMLMNDLVGIVRAIAVNEDNTLQQSMKLETLISDLVRKEVVNSEELQKHFEEEILPELKKKLQKMQKKAPLTTAQ